MKSSKLLVFVASVFLLFFVGCGNGEKAEQTSSVKEAADITSMSEKTDVSSSGEEIVESVVEKIDAAEDEVDGLVSDADITSMPEKTDVSSFGEEIVESVVEKTDNAETTAIDTAEDEVDSLVSDVDSAKSTMVEKATDVENSVDHAADDLQKELP